MYDFATFPIPDAVTLDGTDRMHVLTFYSIHEAIYELITLG